MTMPIQPSHVAVLVPSVRKAAAFLSRFDFKIGAVEEWEGEGTREIYVEMDKANSLLLMEPMKAGAYQRALDKRGPGLHHLAIDVLNLEAYLGGLGGSGWLLHPNSIKTIAQVKTAYLARPGFPGLIEVQQKAELKTRPLFVERVSFALDAKLSRLLAPIGLEDIVKPVSGAFELSLGGHVVRLPDLLVN